MDGWLTSEKVEHIQWAVQRGRPVRDFVNDLRHATLPALLEYGCLRATFDADSIPPLPPAIATSPLGKALDSAAFPQGRRDDGRSDAVLSRVDTQPVEFISIAAETDLERDIPTDPAPPWELYTIRFTRSAQAAGFSSTVASGLAAALYEMTRNALEHARSPRPVMVGYQAEAGIALFCVVDVGRGVLASLQTCKDYSHLTKHDDALSTAIQEGTSRHGYRKGGLGFRQVFQSLAEFNGHLRFRTGNASLEIIGTDCGPNMGTWRGTPHLNGFQVAVCCRARPQAASERPVI